MNELATNESLIRLSTTLEPSQLVTMRGERNPTRKSAVGMTPGIGGRDVRRSDLVRADYERSVAL